MHLLVAVVTATLGRQVGFKMNSTATSSPPSIMLMICRSVISIWTQGLEELHHLGFALTRNHRWDARLDGRIVCPSFPLDILREHAQDRWNLGAHPLGQAQILIAR
jgi:hypothetical protein